MKLEELYNTRKYYTDKGDIHDYIKGYYENEFKDRNKPTHLLEVGMGLEGGSIDLWLDWFIDRSITLVEFDKNLIEYYKTKRGEQEALTIINKSAYEQSTIDEFPNDYFDYIIDDGPHTLQTQLYFIKNWLPKVKVGGKLIVEDVQDIGWIEYFNLLHNQPHKTYDLRYSKGRYDDIIYEITKNNK
jgi:hypothetical protein